MLTQTAIAIKNITDRALYERIVNAILRHKYSDLENLIESGINAYGETVKDPLDGFCQTSSGNYAFIEHTTDDTNLDLKWLYDHQNYKGKGKPTRPEGDLIKAIKKADAIRKSVPEAKFTVYLTTNQDVKSSLWEDVIKIAVPSNVTVELVELKIIAHFLDNDPKGQYIRKQLLNIDQELLSIELLREIQIECQKQYANSNFIESSKTIYEWNLSELITLLDQKKNYLTFIHSESGYGKSTLCYSLIEKISSEGGLCFRVDEHVLKHSISFLNLMEQLIHQNREKIFFNADSKTLISTNRITLIVDDINNSDDPIYIFEKLLTWTSNLEQDPNFNIVCPILPRNFSLLSGKSKINGDFNIFQIKKPSEKIANEIAKLWFHNNNIQVSAFDLKQIIQNSGCDPLLLNLAMQLTLEKKCIIHSTTEDIIKTFVIEKITAANFRQTIHEHKINYLLEKIGLCLLINKCVDPEYAQLIGWLNDQELTTFVDGLATDKVLLYFDTVGKMQFRHDRIRDYFLCEGMKVALARYQDHLDIIRDQYFSRILGLAIASSDLCQTDLENLVFIVPQASFNALKYLQNNDRSDSREKLLDAIEKWKMDPAFQSENAVVLSFIISDLMQSDIKDINRVLRNFNDNNAIFATKFRNGDLLGAILYFSSYPDFEPSYGNKYRDMLVEHAAIHHKKTLTQELVLLLKNPAISNNVLKGGLLLAGYLKAEELGTIIIDLWNLYPNDELFLHYFWSFLNCVNEQNKEKLRYSLDYVGKFNKGCGTQIDVYGNLSSDLAIKLSTIQWRLTDEQILIISEYRTEYPDLINRILREIDHPVALKITVDHLSTKLDDTPPGAQFSFTQVEDYWNYSRSNYRLRKESSDFLLSYWQDQENSDKQRRIAYRFWVNNAPLEQLIFQLREINKSDLLYNDSIIRRIYNGDPTAFNEYIQLCKENPRHINIIYRIWKSELIKELIELVRNVQFNDELMYNIHSALINIPTIDAEIIIIELWALIGNSYLAVQLALYVATEKTISLADQVIKNSGEPKDLFKYISVSYSLYTSKGGERISIEKLDVLKPYIKYLTKDSLKVIANLCLRLGYINWLKEVLKPFLDNDYYKQLVPTRDDLLSELLEAIKTNRYQYWLSDLETRNIDHRLVIETIRDFSKQIHTNQQFYVLSLLIREIGSRNDLKLLENIKFDGANLENMQDFITGTTYAVNSRTLK